MRAWPIRDFLLILAIGGGLLIPMLYATQEREAHLTPAPAEIVSEAKRCFAEIRSPHPLQRLTVRHEGLVICDLDAPEMPIEQEWSLPIGRTGLELEVEVTWRPGTPESVLEIALEPDALDRRSATLWGEGEASDYVEFRW